AIIISAVNALTLSPALCAIILKPHQPKNDEEEKPQLEEKPTDLKGKARYYLNRFFTAFNTSFDTMTSKYIKAIKYLSKRKKIAIIGLIVISIIGFFLMRVTPSAFVPQEDDGFIAFSLKLPPGSSLARTNNVL